MHEMIHGLGWASSWGSWIDKLHFLPSFVDLDQSTGNVIGLAPAYIYTRWMADAQHNVWMNTWSDLIRSSVLDALVKVISF